MRSYWRVVARALLAIGLSVLLVLSPLGNQTSFAAKKERGGRSEQAKSGKISEVAPPAAIQDLRPALDDYQPQVTIVSPKPNEVLKDNSVSIKFQVKDLPLFKNEALGLGPHLHVFLDNQPYQAVYDTSKPLVLNDLSPGTHSLRVFASRPWHESFKNEGAYTQTIFHVFTKTQENSPNPDLPLLTYSRPQGSYGAEPIMLDFYLTNAPLHLVAQESSKDDIADWRIRVTVNGDSFVLDRWQPIYLKGFKPGKNWLQLEFLDEKGEPVRNVFNNTARLITYEPNGQDALAKLVRGDLSAAAARGVVDPKYVPEEPKVEEPKPEEPKLEKPEAEEAKAEKPAPEPSHSIEPAPIPGVEPTPAPSIEPSVSPSPEVPAAVEPTPQESPAPKRKGRFKFKPRAIKPSPTPIAPTSEPSPNPTVEVQIEPSEEPAPIETPEAAKAPVEVEPSVSEDETIPSEPVPQPKAKPGFFNRFRRSASPTPAPSPSLPVEDTLSEPLSTPAESPADDAQPELDAESTALPTAPIPAELSAPEPPSEPEVTQIGPAPAKPAETTDSSRFSQFFDRFRRSSPKPSPSISPELPPTLPEIIDSASSPEPEKMTPSESPELIPESVAP